MCKSGCKCKDCKVRKSGDCEKCKVRQEVLERVSKEGFETKMIRKENELWKKNIK
jgi:hypothetical protein